MSFICQAGVLGDRLALSSLAEEPTLEIEANTFCVCLSFHLP